MNEIQTLPALYAGIKFRSRLEARWAIFFDHCGIKWEYEPEGYKLEDGTCYLPDFLLSEIVGIGDLWCEVKGKLTPKDAKKIRAFVGKPPFFFEQFSHPILLVGNIFTHGKNDRYIDRCFNMQFISCPEGLEFFSYAMINGDSFGAVLGVNTQGRPEIFGQDSNYLYDYNEVKTEVAFKKALYTQFTREGRYIDNEARP